MTATQCPDCGRPTRLVPTDQSRLVRHTPDGNRKTLEPIYHSVPAPDGRCHRCKIHRLCQTRLAELARVHQAKIRQALTLIDTRGATRGPLPRRNPR